LTNLDTPDRILRYNGGDSKPNITGFEMRKFLAATNTQRYDPWERAYVNPRPPLPPLVHPSIYPIHPSHPIPPFANNLPSTPSTTPPTSNPSN
jgi:hypothetical protein